MSSSPSPTATVAPVIDDPEVQKLLTQHAFLEPVTTAGGHVRVRCELTRHELLPRAADIEQHLRSKKFVKAKEWYCHDYAQYAPFIVAHRRKPKSLFCNVTGTVLNRIPAEVERHVAGKKFQRLKEHVKISTDSDGDAENDAENDFDANAFEFENAQVLLSDDEEEDDDEEGSGARKSKAKAKGQSEDSDDDDGEEEEEDSEAEQKGDEDEEDDSDMAEFYPDEDEDEDADAGRLDHETIVKLAAQKKRKAPEAAGDEKHEDAPQTKKPKAAPRPVSKARMSSKDRRQQKKAAYKK